MTRFKKILVPLDFSEPSMNALRLAIDLARASGGTLMLLHIGVIPHLTATELGLGAGPVLAEMSETVAQEQRHHLERVAREEIPANLSHQLVLTEGFPPEEILAAVQREGADLVVMGTHGRTGLGRVLLGSVTERVIRACPIPVLVTR